MTRKVSGVLMVNQEGLPIKTTMDSSTTAIYGGMVIALFFNIFPMVDKILNLFFFSA